MRGSASRGLVSFKPDVVWRIFVCLVGLDPALVPPATVGDVPEGTSSRPFLGRSSCRSAGTPLIRVSEVERASDASRRRSRSFGAVPDPEVVREDAVAVVDLPDGELSQPERGRSSRRSAGMPLGCVSEVLRVSSRRFCAFQSVSLLGPRGGSPESGLTALAARPATGRPGHTPRSAAGRSARGRRTGQTGRVRSGPRSGPVPGRPACRPH